MIKPFRTIADVLAAPWVSRPVTVQAPSDRVLRSSKLEDMIYSELRAGDADMDTLETRGAEKMHTFPALSRDVYQSFYSLIQKRVDEQTLSATARKFNTRILDHVTAGEDYPTIKSICEGRELPAYEAASEFVLRTADELDGLLSELGGEKGPLNTLEKLEAAHDRAEDELAGLLEQIQAAKEPNDMLEQAVVAAANQADSKRRQAEAVGKLVDAGIAQHKEATAAVVAAAAACAKEKAREVRDIIGAWSDTPGGMERNEVNLELLKAVRKSPALKDISRYLGHFREIFAQGKKNGYAYGRGEKYALEIGRDLSRAITPELAMLAVPETLPLFLRKYQRGQIKQYRRREPIYRGAGDIICCLDESNSTRGDPAAWGKAVALTLLEIAADGGRKFALIHFSGGESCKTDLFLPGAYTAQDKLNAAETFLGGGTNFETPMRVAMGLMENQSFENADIVFVTDGACALSDVFLTKLRDKQAKRPFTVTGILLDKGGPGMDFSLKTFCRSVYRTSELLGDEIVRRLVSERI